MKIIIVGCGNVGATLAEQLSREGHDITVIDVREQLVENISTSCDVLGIVGNGASFNVQSEAGIRDADLLVAVTGQDELNLLCCLIAKKAGGCHTIARVSNPVYSREISFIRRTRTFHDHQSGTGHCQRNLKTSAFSGSHQNRSIFKRTCRTSQV